MSSNKPIQVALIGYGQYNLKAIVQRHPTDQNNAAKDYPSAKVYKSTSEMLSQEPEVDLVIVTSIPSTHYELCKELLEAGKHIVCEKPFVATSAGALELAALAKQKGKTLAVYQNRRWDSDFILLREFLDKKLLGRIVDVESHFDRHRPDPPSSASNVTWKAHDLPGNGAIFDLGAHLLDQFVVAFGLPDKVTAIIGDQRVYTIPGTGGGSEGGDSFTVHFHYENFRGEGGKMMATARAGVVSAEKQQLRWWVRGTEGSFYKAELDVQEDQLKAGLRPDGFIPLGGRGSAEGKGPEGFVDSRYGMEEKESFGVYTKPNPGGEGFVSEKIVPADPPVTYKRFYQELADAIRGNGPSPVSAMQAAATIRLIELAIQSSHEERTVLCDVNW